VECHRRKSSEPAVDVHEKKSLEEGRKTPSKSCSDGKCRMTDAVTTVVRRDYGGDQEKKRKKMWRRRTGQMNLRQENGAPILVRDKRGICKPSFVGHECNEVAFPKLSFGYRRLPAS
jgi:hypothetical protein